MNYPVWAVPAPGLLIALVAIVHVFISHFAVGGGLYLVVAERKARRAGDSDLLGFVRALSRGFVLLTLVAGALTGVGIWITIGLVQPQATSALVNTFVWAWAVEWTFFAVEIAAAIVYLHGWDSLDARRHLAVGWIYAASSWGSLVVISGILAFMLTSGSWPETHRFADGFFNPTFVPMVALRTAIAAFLAGLYALFAAAFVRDQELKARVARWSATRWIAPAAIATAVAVVWFLAAAAAANVEIAETLGAPSASFLAVVSGVFAQGNAGHPIVRGAARVAIVSALALTIAALGLATLRARRYTRLEAAALMLLGLASLGGAEWVREGLRKPWVIDRYMFVNGVRVDGPAAAAGADPFALETLDQRGMLATAAWVGAPAAFRPGDPAFDALPAVERAAVEDAAGRSIFRVECSVCHTEAAHLGIRRLVRGRSIAALEAVLQQTAKPVGADGQPGAWWDPQVRVTTWLGRRMPPFAGTDAEQHALAVHLARLGGRRNGRRRVAAAPLRRCGGVRRALCGVPRAGRGLADRSAARAPHGGRALRHHRSAAPGPRGDAAVCGQRPGTPRSRGTPWTTRSCRGNGGREMTPLVPLPDPLPQPAPQLLLNVLLQLTFFLHVLAMNVVLGGSILALHWRFSRRSEDAQVRARFLGLFDKALPVALAATVTLGVAPLLFVQVLHGRLLFTSSILMGWLWLAIVPLVIAAYYGAYALASGQGSPRVRRTLAAVVALLAATVAFVQVTNATRSLRPDTFADVYRADPRGLTANLGDPSFWPRYLHLLLGAVAVAAIAVALLGAVRRGADPELGRWAATRGLTVFAVATALNVFVGLLFLIALPRTLLIRMIGGGDALSLFLLATGILLAVALSGAALLALSARRPFAAVHWLGALLVPTLVVMLLLRDDLRRLALRHAGLDVPVPVAAQWGPFAVFVVCLVGAVATIGWMVMVLAQGRSAVTEE